MSFLTDILSSLFGKKKPVPTPLRTADFEMLPVRAREEAFFSSTVEDARILEAMQARIDQEIVGVQNGGGTMSAGRFAAEMKEILGVGPTDESLTHERFKLIHNFQISRIHNLAAFVRNTQDEGMRDAFPAKELVRQRQAENERDWHTRWQTAGGQFYGPANDRMIAAVDDPIWTEISRFGTPYPPFDFNSGMGTINVSRREAEELGVIAPGEEIPAPPNPLEEPMQASVATLGEAGLDFLRKAYGDNLVIENGIASLRRPVIASNMGQKGPIDFVSDSNFESLHPRGEHGRFALKSQGAVLVKEDQQYVQKLVHGVWNKVHEGRHRSVLGFVDVEGLGSVNMHWGKRGNPQDEYRGGWGVSHMSGGEGGKHWETTPASFAEVLMHGKNRPSSQRVRSLTDLEIVDKFITDKKTGQTIKNPEWETAIPHPHKRERFLENGRFIVFQKEHPEHDDKWYIVTSFDPDRRRK